MRAVIITVMSLTFRMVVAASLIAILGQPSVRALPGRNNDKEEKLIAKIRRENNPGKKARLQLRLAKLELTEADEAYHARDFAEGRGLLQKYLGYVRDSWATLHAADSEGRKHLGAFKDLEISLRENDRFLEDLGHRVPYPESDTVMKIEMESSEVHNQVLEAIFPAGVPPKARGKHALPPRSSMPWKPGVIKS